MGLKISGFHDVIGEIASHLNDDLWICDMRYSGEMTTSDSYKYTELTTEDSSSVIFFSSEL